MIGIQLYSEYHHYHKDASVKFVMFPVFSTSHYLLLAKLREEFSVRGHEVS